MFKLLVAHGLDDFEHMEYLDEECCALDFSNAWANIFDVAKTGGKTLNSNNLMCCYILGISRYDPIKPRLFPPDPNGIKDKAFTVVFDDMSEEVIHFRSIVRKADGSEISVEELRPGDRLPGTVFGIFPSEGTFREEMSTEPFVMPSGTTIVPQKGRHIIVQTNEPPDIDVDFSPAILDQIIPFCMELWGADHVVPVCTYQRFSMKSALRDVCCVFGKSPIEADMIVDELPDDVEKLKVSDKDYGERFDQIIAESETLRKWSVDPRMKLAVWFLKHSSGRVRTYGKHASAMVISKESLDGRIPMITRDGVSMSSWVEGQNRSELSLMGYVKFDRLGLQTLKDCDDCTRLAISRGNIDPAIGLFRHPVIGDDWSDIAYLDDPLVIDAARQGHTIGCFQFESAGLREMLKSMEVDSFNDLIAANAMYRPAILKAKVDGVEGGQIAYAMRKKGEIEYDLPALLQPYLGYTYGLPIYQEQIMYILNLVGGIPMTDCNEARKAISKKKEKILLKYGQLFADRAVRTVGWSRDKAQQYFNDTIVSWAGYGFNKSHSCAYAMLAARTLYLKTHFPIEFFCSFMASLKRAKKDYERLKLFCSDAVRYGIEILGADVNTSGTSFTIAPHPTDPSREVIRFGLGQVKNVGKQAEHLVANRPYQSFDDFLERGASHKSVVESLIDAGALDSLAPDPLSPSRAQLRAYFEQWRECSRKGVGVGILKIFMKLLGLDKVSAAQVDKDFREALANKTWEEDEIFTEQPDDVSVIVEMAEESDIPLPDTAPPTEQERKLVPDKRRMMSVREFRAFLKARLGNVFDWHTELRSAFVEATKDIPTPSFEDVPEDSPVIAFRKQAEIYGASLPFFHPMRFVAKKGKARWIRDFGKRETWHRRVDGSSREVSVDLIEGLVVSVTHKEKQYLDDKGNVKDTRKFHRVVIDDGYDRTTITFPDSIWELKDREGGEIQTDERGMPLIRGYDDKGMKIYMRSRNLPPNLVVKPNMICRFKVRSPSRWGFFICDLAEANKVEFDEQQRHPVIPVDAGVDWCNAASLVPKGVVAD
jgi:hypothetical protein